jgi:UDP-glucose 4-epimerase
MAGPSILVTGGSGLVGANAISLLQQSGEQPVLFDIAVNERLLDAVGVDLGSLPVVRGDVLDLPGLISAIRDHEVGRVLHLAAFLGEEVQRRPYAGVRLNLMGTANVLEASRLEGVARVVFASSGTVYLGSLGEGSPAQIDETIAPNPLSIYAATKAAAEFLGRTYAKRFGFEFVAVRFAALYGPSPAALKATREQAIQAMIRAALKKERAEVAWPYARTELLYGKDAAKSVVLACLKERLKHDLFHVGSGERLTGEEIARAIAERFPGCEIELVKGARAMPYPEERTQHDLSRAKKELGYEPGYPLARAIEDYAATLRKLEGL